MIQITKWLEPIDDTWYQGTYITVYEWLIIQKEHLTNVTGKKVIIKTNKDGFKAVFRERIK